MVLQSSVFRAIRTPLEGPSGAPGVGASGFKVDALCRSKAGGFRIKALGFLVGLGVGLQGLGIRAQGLGFWAQGVELQGFRVLGLGFRASGLNVEGLGSNPKLRHALLKTRTAEILTSYDL